MDHWTGGRDDGAVRRITAAVPSGSHLVRTHPARGRDVGGAGTEAATRFRNERAGPPFTGRGRARIAASSDGVRPLAPGHRCPAPGGVPDPPAPPWYRGSAGRP
ncbi:hypothetical protein ABZX30_15795 [Streptomyces sp. NPDC004542]|uniref:hypothetical protein n=1 Tax=Streptomyces sp. NPDC004542 TaxID=3154281 RepID=UPI0033BD9847